MITLIPDPLPQMMRMMKAMMRVMTKVKKTVDMENVMDTIMMTQVTIIITMKQCIVKAMRKDTMKVIHVDILNMKKMRKIINL